MSKKSPKKFNTTYTVLIIFLILAGIVFWIDQPGKLSKEERDQKVMNIFDPIKEENLAFVSIQDSDTDVQLSKENGEWVILNDGNFRADQKIIDSIIENMNYAAKGEIVARNAKNHESFMVTNESGTAVEIRNSNGEVLANFIVGKKGPVFNSQYLRHPDKDNVVLIKKNLEQVFNKNSLDFRDKTIWSFEPTSIKSIAIKSVDGKKVFVKEDNVWKLEGDKEADNSKIDAVIKIASSLEALGFEAGEEFQFNPGEEDLKVFLEMEDGGANSLLIKEIEEQFYAIKDSANETFIVSSFIVNQLKQDVSVEKEVDSQ